MRLILLISMIIAILFAFLSGFYTWWKINHLKKQSLSQNFTNSYQDAWNNSNFGTLLTDLKINTKNYLEDHQLVYAINTIFRNNYKSSCILNFESEYEQKNLTQLANQNIDCNQFDFLLINANLKIINDLIHNLKKINNKGLIFITNINKREPLFQNIKNFCVENNLRMSYEKIGKGIILIAK